MSRGCHDLRAKLVQDAVEGWVGIPSVLQETKDMVWKQDKFPISMSKFGIEEAIRQSKDQDEFEARRKYWFGLSEIGRNRLINEISRKIEKRIWSK